MINELLEHADFAQGEDGRRLHMVRLGSGPLVILVHGFPESWISWRHQLPALADAGFTAAAIEVRGYGESYSPTDVEEYTLAQHVSDLLLVMDHIGTDEAVLVGHDWGGPQVHAAALLEPERVQAVATLSYPMTRFPRRPPSEVWDEIYPGGGFYQQYFLEPGEVEAEFMADPVGAVRRVLYGLSADRPPSVNALVRPPGTSHFLEGLPDPERLPSWITEEEVAYYAGALAKSGAVGALNRYRAQHLDVAPMRPHAGRKVTQPAMFIGGAEDPGRHIVPGQDRFADPLAGCADPRSSHVIEGAGHWVQQEAAGEVTGLLLEFVDEVG